MPPPPSIPAPQEFTIFPCSKGEKERRKPYYQLVSRESREFREFQGVQGISMISLHFVMQLHHVKFSGNALFMPSPHGDFAWRARCRRNVLP